MYLYKYACSPCCFVWVNIDRNSICLCLDDVCCICRRNCRSNEDVAHVHVLALGLVLCHEVGLGTGMGIGACLCLSPVLNGRSLCAFLRNLCIASCLGVPGGTAVEVVDWQGLEVYFCSVGFDLEVELRLSWCFLVWR